MTGKSQPHGGRVSSFGEGCLELHVMREKKYAFFLKKRLRS
jgi:hypothetical protein